MKTFKEFRIILERYYKPAEKLPSGRSPIQKATEKASKRSTPAQRHPLAKFYRHDPVSASSESERRKKQSERIGQVKRGSRNQKFDRTPSKNKHIKITPGKGHTKISDTKNNIHFTVIHHGANSHSVSFDHTNKEMHNPNASNRDKMKFMKKIHHMYHHEVAHRYPHGHVVTNIPIENTGKTGEGGKEANTRSKLYSKLAGFGPVQYYRQHKLAGNKPSPRQLKSGSKQHRFKGLSDKEAMDIKYRNNR